MRKWLGILLFPLAAQARRRGGMAGQQYRLNAQPSRGVDLLPSVVRL